MAKPVLVIGGSAFTGRIFSIQASKNNWYDLHVVNRGQFPLNLHNVREYKCDRHSPRMIARLVPDIQFEALVDFCAYNPGEIASVIKALKGRIRQYIFFSTASIYAPPGDTLRDEDAPVVSDSDGGAVDEYVRNKLILEEELMEACTQNDMAYTILRPTFIYGPFNYAPRESYYVEMIARKHIVPVPTDATGRWNFVYAFDVARALHCCIGNMRAFNQAFNLAAPEVCTYESFMSDLRAYHGRDFQSREVTIAQVEEEHIPLPFPLDVSELYDGQKICRTFDFAYTPLSEGMEKTFRIFYSLFIT